MLNHIVIQGRFVRDPELRRTASGTAVCSFTLAVERDRKDQNGERETDFIDCVTWSGRGEFANNYFKKGSMAIVAGRLAFRVWIDKEGNNHRSAEVVVSSLYFGESKRTDTSGAEARTTDFYTLPDDDGELPF